MADPKLLGLGTRRGLLAVVLVVVTLLGAACSGSDGSSTPTTAVPLDGTPRYPDAEGVVVDIAADFSMITLDGDRRYGIDKDVQSFSALDGSTQQLMGRKGQYVQVGLRNNKVRWIGGIGALIRVPGQPDVAYFTGNLVRVRKGKLVFEDGTVLTLAAEAAVPVGAVRVRATIDATAHTVVDLAAV